MKKKKWLAGILCIAAAAGTAAGICGGVRTAAGRPVPVVSASELDQRFYTGSGSMEGIVTSDVTQDVYLQDTETVARVLVKEGDAVKEGDVLMEYDTTRTRLNLEKEKLNREQISLNIRMTEENIRTLKKIKPVRENPETDPGDEIPEEYFPAEPGPPEQELPADPPPAEAPLPSESPRQTCQVRMDGGGQNIQKMPEIEVSSGTSLREYLNSLREEEWKAFVPAAKGCVFGGWYADAGCTVPYDMDAPVTGDITLYARWFRQYEAAALKEFTEKAVPYNRPSENDPEAGTLLNPYRYLAQDGAVVYPSFMNCVKKAAAEALEADSKAHIYFTLEVCEGDSLSGAPVGFYIQDAVKLIDRDFPAHWRGVLDARTGTLQDTFLPSGEGSRAELPSLQGGNTFRTGKTAAAAVLTALNADGSGGTGLISGDSAYTEEQLAQALREQEEKLKALKLDLEESELKIKNTGKAVQEGAVAAKISGIVRKAGDPEHPPGDGSPFLQITGTAGMYIRGGLSELMLDRIREGDALNVTSLESGISCRAVIREISPYPDESGMFQSYGTARASSYPFIAYVAEGGEMLNSQEWVMISPEETGMDGGAEDLYLWKVFILEEDGRKFVYLRDESGKLKKQEITTGRRSGEGLEVLSGITRDDWLAFPFGKNIRNGAKTRESTMSELYGN